MVSMFPICIDQLLDRHIQQIWRYCKGDVLAIAVNCLSSFHAIHIVGVDIGPWNARMYAGNFYYYIVLTRFWLF